MLDCGANLVKFGELWYYFLQKFGGDINCCEGGDPRDDDDQAPVLADSAHVALGAPERAVSDANALSYCIPLRISVQKLNTCTGGGGNDAEYLQFPVRNNYRFMQLPTVSIKVYIAEVLVPEPYSRSFIGMDEHIRRYDILGVILDSQLLQRLGDVDSPAPENLYGIPVEFHTKRADSTAGPLDLSVLLYSGLCCCEAGDRHAER